MILFSQRSRQIKDKFLESGQSALLVGHESNKKSESKSNGDAKVSDIVII